MDWSAIIHEFECRRTVVSKENPGIPPGLVAKCGKVQVSGAKLLPEDKMIPEIYQLAAKASAEAETKKQWSAEQAKGKTDAQNSTSREHKIGIKMRKPPLHKKLKKSSKNQDFHYRTKLFFLLEIDLQLYKTTRRALSQSGSPKMSRQIDWICILRYPFKVKGFQSNKTCLY